MDDNKELSNEETQATPEHPAEIREEPDVAQEVAQKPVQEGTRPADAEESVLGEETPAEEILTEEEQASASEMNETPTTTEDSVQQDETVAQTAEAQTETPAQTDEALVEVLDAAPPQDGERKPAEGEQPANAAEASSAPPSDDSPTVESVIEAVLFATDEPLPEGKLAGIVEATAKQVRDCVESLNAKYEANRNAFRIEQIAGGYQMLTQPIYNSWLKKMVKARSDNKLSPAAMETLAIIAYKQPIIRADIEAIRGVAVGEVIRSLMYKGLVKIAGRAEILGRPMLYGTTKKFLEVFGLNSVKDLPKAEDLKNPDRG